MLLQRQGGVERDTPTNGQGGQGRLQEVGRIHVLLPVLVLGDPETEPDLGLTSFHRMFHISTPI